MASLGDTACLGRGAEIDVLEVGIVTPCTEFRLNHTEFLLTLKA